MLIVDAHLDLAYNALRGRDVLRSAYDQTPDADGIPSVGLPDLRDGGVELICATIFCEPSIDGKPGYRTPEEAHETAQRQIRWYLQQAEEVVLNIITSPTGLTDEPSPFPDTQNAIILMEGADPIRRPAEVGTWFDLGVRIVGMAWKRTRYAGGTGAPGPLTPEGVELVASLDHFGMIHDVSHLAEDSFWHLMDLTAGPLMASHSNCRSIVPTDRQLSDEMLRELLDRDAVIGINFFDKFLLRPKEYGHRRATLDDVVSHIKHVCDMAGDATHVGLGTDMDGGLGREQIPREIETSADLPKLADALTDANFPDPAVADILGRNWLNFFRRNLPRLTAE